MRVHSVLFAGVFLVVCTAVVSAQEQAARNIVSVEFTGLHRTTASFAQDIVRLRPGDRAEKAALDEAVARLLRTGRFQTASYELVEQPAGVRVVFEVHERTIVASIDFEGNSKFRD
ncbi:MAG: POTRA domain-containing protein, partial [Planctomycetota bacterium]